MYVAAVPKQESLALIATRARSVDVRMGQGSSQQSTGCSMAATPDDTEESAEEGAARDCEFSSVHCVFPFKLPSKFKRGDAPSKLQVGGC